MCVFEFFRLICSDNRGDFGVCELGSNHLEAVIAHLGLNSQESRDDVGVGLEHFFPVGDDPQLRFPLLSTSYLPRTRCGSVQGTSDSSPRSFAD